MDELIVQLPNILMGIYLFFKEVGKAKPDEAKDDEVNELKKEVQEMKEELSFIKGKLSNRK